MGTTILDAGLDEVTSDTDDRCCQYSTGWCSLAATHAGVFSRPRGCPCPNRILYCLYHQHVILNEVPVNDGAFYCGRCGPLYVAQFLRMEAL